MDPAYDKVGLVAFAPHSGKVCTLPKTTNGPPSDYDAVHEQLSLRAALERLQDVGHVAARSRARSSRVDDQLHQGRRDNRLRGRDRQGRTTLAANHDPEAQDVIIFMTDGEANYGACSSRRTRPGSARTTPSSYRTNPCGQAVTSARAGVAAGVWVFGIAYDTPGAGCLGWKRHRHRHRRCHVRPEGRQPVRLPRVAGDHRQRRREGDCLRP